MNARIDTKTKVITFGESVEYRKMGKVLNAILPGWDTKDDFTIDIDKSLSVTKPTEVKVPIDEGYHVVDDYPWVEIKPRGNVKLDNKRVQPIDYDKGSVYLKEGIFDMNIIY